ncbi:MAG: high-potential iron-sulfur protein [Dokdonella sp.]
MITPTINSESQRSRRQFLQLAVFGAGAAAMSTLLIGKARAADLPHLTLDDATARALGYVEDSTTVDADKFPNHKPDQACLACQQYRGAAGSEYGPCTLFTGKAVHFKGWCAGFLAKSA